MVTKQLGKITNITFGAGGYDDAMIGVSFSLGSKDWGCGDFWGAWRGKPSPSARWTEDSRIKTLGAIVMRLDSLLADAKVPDISKLVDKPIEATFQNDALLSWRIMTEVL